MSNIIGGVIDFYKGLPSLLPERIIEIPVERIVIKESTMIIGQSRHFVRLAGLSGAVAVAMSAYGAHGFKDDESKEMAQRKKIFDSGNHMHLIHSLALLGSPLTRRPVLVGSLLTLGILVFSGSCYYNAMTGDKRVRMITPYGGMAFILAWLAMML
ncbi:transmembrane protein 256 homolog isoform X1 [Mytilus edulis]|uniref:Transmembrane protein 256 homolog n=1 Tax=Mytilus edulis TaxID=6550 RepID=A0A8S3V4L4_MYTED|nr:Transmembrane protein 256 homolog [Mytilus edulis]